jgi:hypothetical protein
MGTINVAWWNLENRFDTEDDPISQDFKFTLRTAGPLRRMQQSGQTLLQPWMVCTAGLASSCLVSPRPPWRNIASLVRELVRLASRGVPTC